MRFYWSNSIKMIKRLKLHWFCIILCSSLVYAQKTYTTSDIYRTYFLNEKNLFRVNKGEKDSIQYLIPLKQLPKEATTYYQQFVPDLEPINTTHLISYKKEYYLIQSNRKQTIVSILHKTYRPDIDAPFYILGTNHCIIPKGASMCYPTLKQGQCSEATINCKSLNTKR